MSNTRQSRSGAAKANGRTPPKVRLKKTAQSSETKRKTAANGPSKKNGPSGRKAKSAQDNKSRPGQTASDTANQRKSAPDPVQLAHNMMKVWQTSHKLAATYMQKQQSADHTESDPLNVADAFAKLLTQLVADPDRLIKAQADLWRRYGDLWQYAGQRAMGQQAEPPAQPVTGDKRFKHQDWSENLTFDVIKQSYLITADWLQNLVSRTAGLDDRTQHKVEFFTKQISDAYSPTNFFWTNPEVLQATIDENGENLVRGLNNILEDLDRGGGQLNIKQTDMEYFEVGRNLATAPGKVVYQNHIMQLLQFEPTTPKVYRRPLLIFPPWINKYYILDMREDNSFIRWCVAKGYTVFVVSWVNPDGQLVKKTFEDYLNEGIFQALDAVKKATGEDEVNTIGYCVGGTLLGSALAYMAAKKDNRITSATFLAAQLDFSEAGDLKVFIDDEQLQSIEQKMEAAGGYLEGANMAQTFNMLRANDLIWSFVVNNYLLGKEPFRFDLLYWNADATRMPQGLHMFYLREFYHHNKLAKGELVLGGVRLDMAKVKIPVFLQSSREDHIAPCKSVFKMKNLFAGPTEFIVAGSGHIAGVINPPHAQKYQFWLAKKDVDEFDAWWAEAEERPGSWWPHWETWLGAKSGEKVPARQPGDRHLDVIEDAPGSYVKVRS